MLLMPDFEYPLPHRSARAQRASLAESSQNISGYPGPLPCTRLKEGASAADRNSSSFAVSRPACMDCQIVCSSSRSLRSPPISEFSNKKSVPLKKELCYSFCGDKPIHKGPQMTHSKKTIKIRISPVMFNAIKQCTKELGYSTMSEFVRISIREKIDSEWAKYSDGKTKLK